MIDLDITLIYQSIGFLVLLLIVSTLLTKPFLRILSERRDKIDGARAEAARIEEGVESGMGAYDKRLKEATAHGLAIRGALRAEATAAEQEILESAKKEASTYLSGVRGELQKEKDSALKTLKEEAKSLSSDIAGKVLNRKLLSVILPLILTLVPALAFGTTEGGHDDGGGSSAMLWKIGNFVLLVILLYVAWKKGIKGGLEQRSDDIKNALEEARRVKESAEAKEREYKSKLSELEASLGDVEKRLKHDGEVEKEKIVRDAEALSEKIKEQAKLVVGQEVNKAKIEIQKEVATLAVEMAEELLKKEISDDDQKRLAKDYLERVRLN